MYSNWYKKHEHNWIKKRNRNIMRQLLWLKQSNFCLFEVQEHDPGVTPSAQMWKLVVIWYHRQLLPGFEPPKSLRQTETARGQRSSWCGRAFPKEKLKQHSREVKKPLMWEEAVSGSCSRASEGLQKGPQGVCIEPPWFRRCSDTEYDGLTPDNSALLGEWWLRWMIRTPSLLNGEMSKMVYSTISMQI